MAGTDKKQQKGKPFLLMRGESVIASTGIAMAAIFMVAMLAAGGWTVVTERRAARSEARANVESCGQLLASSIEPLFEGDRGRADVLALLATTARTRDLVRCRVVLPDGGIVADAFPPKLAVRRNQDSLPIESEEFDTRSELAEASIPIKLAAHGTAELQIAKALTRPSWLGWRAQTGIGLIGAAGFAAFLAVYRRLRSRLQAVGAIREALLAMNSGETTTAALVVSGRFGAEAQAWNKILSEREQLGKDLATERAKESLGARADVKNDLAYACDALSQGLILVDDTMRIKYANGAAAAFLRVKRELLAGTALADHVKDKEVIDSVRGIAAGSVRRRASVEVRRAEGEGSGIFRFSVRPVRRDDSASALMMIEDVTQQRVADEARNSFVAQATHELRTPLTNIRLYVEQAIEVGETDAAARTHALDVINQESRRLERIVGDMLSVSEIEAGSFKLRSNDVRLDNLFEGIRGEYEAQAHEKHLTMTLSLPPKLPVIQGDRDKIVLALHNLIGNAIKYTPEGGKIDVKVEVQDDKLQVDVQDSGIGINPDEAEMIFEKFYRAKDKRVSAITGTGLGLALAREVVRLHGGDITVRSQIDQGSTFTMTLPTHAEAA